jgi:hypothetical protein
MIGLRGKNDKIGNVIISIIAILMVYYVIGEDLKVLVHDGLSESLALPPWMIARVFSGGEVARRGAEMVNAFPPQSPDQLKMFSTEVTRTLNPRSAPRTLLGTHASLFQYFPDLLSRYTGEQGDLGWWKMLSRIHHHYILWCNSQFSSFIHKSSIFSLHHIIDNIPPLKVKVKKIVDTMEIYTILIIRPYA